MGWVGRGYCHLGLGGFSWVWMTQTRARERAKVGHNLAVIGLVSRNFKCGNCVISCANFDYPYLFRPFDFDKSYNCKYI